MTERRSPERDKTRVMKGKAGEEIAVRHLMAKQFRILQRNYRCPYGEIDIVAVDGHTIVFVEVKSKNALQYGRPEEAVDRRKQAKLSRAALIWLRDNSSLNKPARFDVISINFRPGQPPEIVHYKNAFDSQFA